MAVTALVLDKHYLLHDTGGDHPECPQRLEAIQQRLHRTGLDRKCLQISPRPATRQQIEWIHAPAYVDHFRQACGNGERDLDSVECPIAPNTYEIALLSAGGVLAAVDAIMAGEVRNAFCAVRPPGHHAERDEAKGFCYFNNIAIAAEHLRRNHGLDRIFILDWDVHHANGTQHQFEDDPHVFVCSIHQHPLTLFPGTGFKEEQGTGPGEGYTLNIPVMPGTGDGTYDHAFQEQILPAMEAFAPQFVLISAGFDAHCLDPLAQINLSTEMFGWMTAEVMKIAHRHAGDRVLSVLEGGYDFRALADSVQLHLKVLMGLSEFQTA